jgi:hypothetical protein
MVRFLYLGEGVRVQGERPFPTVCCHGVFYPDKTKSLQKSVPLLSSLPSVQIVFVPFCFTSDLEKSSAT